MSHVCEPEKLHPSTWVVLYDGSVVFYEGEPVWRKGYLHGREIGRVPNWIYRMMSIGPGLEVASYSRDGDIPEAQWLKSLGGQVPGTVRP